MTMETASETFVSDTVLAVTRFRCGDGPEGRRVFGRRAYLRDLEDQKADVLRYLARHPGATLAALYEGVTGQGTDSPGADPAALVWPLQEAGLVAVERDPASFDLHSPLCAWLTDAGREAAREAEGNGQ